MEVGSFADLADLFSAQRIDAHYEFRQHRDIGQKITTGMTDDPAIGVHAYDLGVLRDTRNRVPCGMEGRIECVAVALDLDLGDNGHALPYRRPSKRVRSSPVTWRLRPFHHE